MLTKEKILESLLNKKFDSLITDEHISLIWKIIFEIRSSDDSKYQWNSKKEERKDIEKVWGKIVEEGLKYRTIILSKKEKNWRFDCLKSEEKFVYYLQSKIPIEIILEIIDKSLEENFQVYWDIFFHCPQLFFDINDMIKRNETENNNNDNYWNLILPLERIITNIFNDDFLKVIKNEKKNHSFLMIFPLIFGKKIVKSIFAEESKENLIKKEIHNLKKDFEERFFKLGLFFLVFDTFRNFFMKISKFSFYNEAIFKRFKKKDYFSLALEILEEFDNNELSIVQSAVRVIKKDLENDDREDERIFKKEINSIILKIRS